MKNKDIDKCQCDVPAIVQDCAQPGYEKIYCRKCLKPPRKTRSKMKVYIITNKHFIGKDSIEKICLTRYDAITYLQNIIYNGNKRLILSGVGYHLNVTNYDITEYDI